MSSLIFCPRSLASISEKKGTKGTVWACSFCSFLSKRQKLFVKLDSTPQHKDFTKVRFYSTTHKDSLGEGNSNLSLIFSHTFLVIKFGRIFYINKSKTKIGAQRLRNPNLGQQMWNSPIKWEPSFASINLDKFSLWIREYWASFPFCVWCDTNTYFQNLAKVQVMNQKSSWTPPRTSLI